MKRPPSTTIWATRQRVSCRRVVWASLGPFFLAAIAGSLVFRATRGGGSGLQEAVVQRHPARVLEETLPCLGSNCELQGGSALTVLGGAGGSSSSGGGGAPSAAAAGSAAATASSGAGQRGGSTAPGDLPKLFLFIGILSGRGYRHRRLAVREAWSNKAQIPGQVVSKFILSEDERTPQVSAACTLRSSMCMAEKCRASRTNAWLRLLGGYPASGAELAQACWVQAGACAQTQPAASTPACMHAMWPPAG